jgi:hypothetical protein
MERCLHLPGVEKVGASGVENVPSRQVWGRELPEGFDSRPPPRGEKQGAGAESDCLRKGDPIRRRSRPRRRGLQRQPSIAS